jgi:hypothetical protein
MPRIKLSRKQKKLYKSKGGSWFDSSYSSYSSSGTGNLRCNETYVPRDIVANQPDINKLKDLEITSEAKNKLESLKKTNEKKRKASGDALKTLESQEKLDKDSALRSLSLSMKEYAKKRTQKLISKPKDSRIQKLSCSLKGLMDTLGQCTTINNNPNEIKITSIDSLISIYSNKFKDESSGNKAFADSYIKFIVNKDSNAVDKIKAIQNTYPKAAEELNKLISSIATCSN